MSPLSPPRPSGHGIPSGRGARRRTKHRDRPLKLEWLETRNLLSGWTPLVHKAPPSGIGTMMLLTDGTVMAEGPGQTNTWYKLTPDASGSYINGTWTQLASMHYSRLYFGSNVLPDGRVLVQGGEYSNAGSETRTGEIYDPLTNHWTDIQNFPLSQFGDDPTVLTQDGRVLAGHLSDASSYFYDPATDNWTFAATKLANDKSSEESWMLLPDGSVLTYDVWNNGHSQRYVPAQGQWVDAGTVPVNLSSSSVGEEMGPVTMLLDGRSLHVGATNHTAIYDPATNSWVAGPDMPSGMGADDAPGALLPNGHFIFAADHPLFHGPTSIFDFDPATNTLSTLDTTGVGGLSSYAFGDRMLELPTGQILLTTSTNQLYVYTSDGAADPSVQPVIRKVQDNGDGTFGLAGIRLNGMSEGAAYGDDAEMSSNYPIVSLTDANGNVFYARTYGWSPGVVQSGGNFLTTQFTLPAGLAAGTYQLTVSAAGITSAPVNFTYNGPDVSLAGLGLGSGTTTTADGSAVASLVTVSGNTASATDNGTAATDATAQVAAVNVSPATTVVNHGASVTPVDATFAGDPLGWIL